MTTTKTMAAAREVSSTRKSAAKPVANIPLTEDRLVSTALAIINTSNVESLTMRRLADELGVTQMAAYHHVKGKDQLLELALDRLLASVVLPPKDFGTWDERLLERFVSMIDALSAYPGMGAYLLGSRLPRSGRRLVRLTVQMLIEEGFNAEEALFIQATVSTWSHGYLALSARMGSKTIVDYYSVALPNGQSKALRLEPHMLLRTSVQAVLRGVKATIDDGVFRSQS